jgi:hypothetical protein
VWIRFIKLKAVLQHVTLVLVASALVSHMYNMNNLKYSDLGNFLAKQHLSNASLKFLCTINNGKSSGSKIYKK